MPGSRELAAPDSVPPGRTASPAAEQPAAEVRATRGDFSGVGPAPFPGVHRGEDFAKGKTQQQLKDARRSGVGPSRPIDPAMPDMA
jgi:hypothetical protein